MLCSWKRWTYIVSVFVYSCKKIHTCGSCFISSNFIFISLIFNVLNFNYNLKFQGIIAFLFILVGNITELIDFASFLIWIFYGGAMVALLVLRKTRPDLPRPYKVPVVIPVFVLGISIFLSIVPIIHDPSVKYLFGIGFILFGVFIYTYFIYYKRRPSIMGNYCFV